ILKWMKRFSVEELFTATDISSERLPPNPDHDDINSYFDAIPKICSAKRLPEGEERLRYARGILRNRIYVNEKLVMPLMSAAVEAGMDPEDIVEYAKVTKSWTEFRLEMEAVAN